MTYDVISSIVGEGVLGGDLENLDFFFLGNTSDSSLGEDLRLRASDRAEMGVSGTAPASWVVLEGIEG
jgi:hypothetical protein